jgi:hypothetical protein
MWDIPVDVKEESRIITTSRFPHSCPSSPSTVSNPQGILGPVTATVLQLIVNVNM